MTPCPDEKDTSYSNTSGLSERVDKLENKMDDMRNMISTIDNNSCVLQALLSRLETALQRNTDVILEMEKTLFGMQSEIKSVSLVTNQLRADIDGVGKRFEIAEEKNKIDFRVITKEILTNKIIWLLGGGIALFEIIRSQWFELENIFKKLIK